MTRKTPRSKVKLYLDCLLLASFLLVSAPQATGIPIHEWISFAFIPIFMVHLLINWGWIVRVTLGLFRKLGGETRFNYFWNLLLYVVMTISVYSGVVVSEAALPGMGFKIEIDPFWSTLHNASSNLLFPLIGIHLALHWQWIVGAARKHLFKSAATEADAA